MRFSLIAATIALGISTNATELTAQSQSKFEFMCTMTPETASWNHLDARKLLIRLDYGNDLVQFVSFFPGRTMTSPARRFIGDGGKISEDKYYIENSRDQLEYIDRYSGVYFVKIYSVTLPEKLMNCQPELWSPFKRAGIVRVGKRKF
jgi:hypothetical protein